jgi:drug/metabolite transporter (DMT)-like permease
LRSPEARLLPTLPAVAWLRLLGLGLLLYTLTQGAQFLGLAYLPAVTVNLMLSLTSVVVALLGILLLAERPSFKQWLGVLISVGGAFVYFHPVQIPAGQMLGYVAVVVGVLANARIGRFGSLDQSRRDVTAVDGDGGEHGNRIGHFAAGRAAGTGLPRSPGKAGPLLPGWRWSTPPLPLPCGT